MKSPTLVIVIGIALVLLAIGLKTQQAQEENVVVRPFPNDPHPIAPQIPRVADELAVAKSKAEERAKEAIHASRRLIRRPASLQEGRQLYDAAKAEYDGVVEFMCFGLQTRFAGIEPTAIDARLNTARHQLSKFLQWNARRVRDDGGQVMAGAGDDILSIGLNEIIAWVNGLRPADQRAIDQLIQQLRNLRLASWDDLDG